MSRAEQMAETVIRQIGDELGMSRGESIAFLYYYMADHALLPDQDTDQSLPA